MARANEEAAELLRELADLLSITGGDAFKIRAYEKAARAVEGFPEDVSGLDLPGRASRRTSPGSTSPACGRSRRSARRSPRSCSTSTGPAPSGRWRTCAPRSPPGCGR
ncbi:helix-hairpin-helix domain-containing protein [Actinomadura logoneensis]|uniref:helix-hairpin-helix domain-containing protein n=1 Tax=Actinomadura logoneensis TaxID=2293572 RepID=UPI001F3EAD15|nr:helix-hairpin-helix domain-containing protein [Actinomadura logoneensis]